MFATAESVGTEMCTPTGAASDAIEIDDLGTVILSENTMNWWSAQDWCEKRGMELMTIEDFRCYDGASNPVETGYEPDPLSLLCCSNPGYSCSSFGSAWFWDDPAAIEEMQTVCSPVFGLCELFILKLCKRLLRRMSSQDSLLLFGQLGVEKMVIRMRPLCFHLIITRWNCCQRFGARVRLACRVHHTSEVY